MKLIKRLITLTCLVFVYFIVKELLFLYSSLYSIHPYVAFGFIAIVLLLFIIYVIVPVIRILSIPVFKSPTVDGSDRNSILKSRLNNLRMNKHLISAGIVNQQFNSDEEEYEQYIIALKPAVSEIRKGYVKKVFITTMIAQNGFLDAFILLTTNFSMVKDIFSMYHGRVNNVDLFKIYGSVFRVIAIGGSNVTEELAEGASTFLMDKTGGSIPFIGKILSSISDGLVNATLTARISFIVEGYCSKLVIENQRDLKPNGAVLKEMVQLITDPIIQAIKRVGRKQPSEKRDVSNFELESQEITLIIKKGIEESSKETQDEEEVKSYLNTIKSGMSYISSPLYSAGRFVSNSIKRNP